MIMPVRIPGAIPLLVSVAGMSEEICLSLESVIRDRVGFLALGCSLT